MLPLSPSSPSSLLKFLYVRFYRLYPCFYPCMEARLERKNWSPPLLLELSGSYWSTCTLHAGVKLDVFTPLADGALSARELAARISCDPRALAMLLNA